MEDQDIVHSYLSHFIQEKGVTGNQAGRTRVKKDLSDGSDMR